MPEGPGEEGRSRIRREERKVMEMKRQRSEEAASSI